MTVDNTASLSGTIAPSHYPLNLLSLYIRLKYPKGKLKGSMVIFKLSVTPSCHTFPRSLPLDLGGNAWPRDSHALGQCVSLLCLWVGFTAAVSSTMTPQILSAMAVMLLSYWGVRGSSMPKVRGAHSDTHAHNPRHIYTVCACEHLNLHTFFLTFLHTHTHTPVSHMHYTTLVHSTAHSLRRCWWIRHLELADKERKWGKSCTEKKRGEKRDRNWKREKGLVRQHAGRKERNRSKRSRKQKWERCEGEEEDRGYWAERP